MRKIKKGSLPAKKSFVVLGDGECEKWYVDMLKKNHSDLNINIEPRLSIKKKLSEKFDQIKELSKVYDKVIWIVDYDVILKETRETKKGNTTPQQKFREYIASLSKRYLNVTLIINSPCLEYWLLLHFEQTGKFFDNCDSATERLKKYLPDYTKSEKYYKNAKMDIFSKLSDNLEIAVNYAKQLGEFSFDDTNRGVSEMYKLFEVLEISI